MKKLFMFLSAGLLLATTACQEDDKQVAPDRKALLTETTWQPTAVYADGQKLSKQGIPSVFAWSVKFDADGSYTFRTPDGKSKGEWSFNSDQDEVIFNGGNSWKIKELEKGNFVYEDEMVLVDENDQEKEYDGEFHLEPEN
jgi:hypothetical protein